MAEGNTTPSLDAGLKDKAFSQWARQAADFTDLSSQKYFARMDDTLEDLHLPVRLEEFEHLLELGEKDSAVCLNEAMPKMRERFEAMQTVFRAVERMEAMVKKAREDLDVMEKKICEAEATLETAPSSSSLGASAGMIAAAGEGARSIGSLVQPLLFGSRVSSQTDRESSSPPGKPPAKTFSAEEFFPKSREEEEEEAKRQKPRMN